MKKIFQIKFKIKAGCWAGRFNVAEFVGTQRPILRFFMKKYLKKVCAI
jgi:hypothetical protein